MFGACELSYNNRLILDTYEDGQAYLQLHMPAYAGIFASPAVKRDANGTVSVAWYSEHAGSFQKWEDTDAATRARVAALLGALARAVLKSAEDADDGMAQILLRWLHVLSLPDDLLIVNGQPVLTNWGIVPEVIADDPDKVWQHFQLGIGRFLTDEGETPRARPTTIGGPSSSAAPAAFAQQAAPPPDTGYGSQPPQPSAFSGRCGILPIAIACALALLVLLLLLVPGVLVYPASPTRSITLDDAALAETETVLRQRIDRMKALLGQGVCRAAPGQTRLDGALPDGLGGQAPGPAITPTTLGALPPSPSTLRPENGDGTLSVVDLLEKSTVLVMGRTQDGKISTGTGFFVSPRQVVTNRHVVEDAGKDTIYIASNQLAGVRGAQLASITETSDPGNADFALLNVSGEPSPFMLPVVTASAKGDNVLAAGFPSFFMETDQHFQALINGQQAQAPGMVVTQGIVTVFQDSPSGVPLVLHSADISPGNSGGPLVDYCGRVVGVNTFMRTNRDAQLRLNFALKSESLIRFLQAGGIEPAAPGGPCLPTPLISASAALPPSPSAVRQ